VAQGEVVGWAQTPALQVLNRELVPGVTAAHPFESHLMVPVRLNLQQWWARIYLLIRCNANIQVRAPETLLQAL